MKRREFLKNTALLAVATTTAGAAQAAERLNEAARTPQPVTDDPQPAADTLITSAPMLQNYAETSIGIAFAVSDLANGYVRIGRQPDLSDARKVMCGGYRTTELADHVSQVRVTGLLPATTYYYRVGADRISYKGGYDMKIIGNEEDPHIYHFTTAGRQADSHFAVINDTHVQWEPFGRAIEKIATLQPACVIWNGDASNTEETIEAQKRIYLTPDIDRKDYAAQTPYLFCPGNHDYRGMANRHLERVWMYRQPEERHSRDWDLGRNFAVRTGDIAMIGLDTAEDKMDTNPLFAGLFNSSAYREAQTAWLRDALRQKEIATAPYLVAFCHIPLYDEDPRHNPGDIAPDDNDPRYSAGFAAWQRTCAQMWTPLLQKAKCQLIITAHQHHYRFHPATKERTWAHLVGGGPERAADQSDECPDQFPTVIEGQVADHRLRITVHNLRTGLVQDTFTFKPRR